MNNAKIEQLGITYKHDVKNGTTNVEEAISLSSKQQGEATTITIKTEDWTIDSTQIDEFCKTIKQFALQATGTSKKKNSTAAIAIGAGQFEE